ncbi:hypothetical protein IF1G_05464 [Cordyceps javanica]|uniref:Uncharacterized protein n=1 Tax=Cordyceps javanica TaxID=43265 RepID=A0A545V1N1_9HYPO|nr:hypothetical protein IF1G_05464 [Cordyceps javanica]
MLKLGSCGRDEGIESAVTDKVERGLVTRADMVHTVSCLDWAMIMQQHIALQANCSRFFFFLSASSAKFCFFGDVPSRIDCGMSGGRGSPLKLPSVKKDGLASLLRQGTVTLDFFFALMKNLSRHDYAAPSKDRKLVNASVFERMAAVYYGTVVFKRPGTYPGT